MNRACFPKEKTPEFTKMGEIHELFVLALSLVWFAGATPEVNLQKQACFVASLLEIPIPRLRCQISTHFMIGSLCSEKKEELGPEMTRSFPG